MCGEYGRQNWLWFRVLLHCRIMRELCFVALLGWLKRSVIASGQGKPPRSQNEWSFVGKTPAELCLLLLRWLTCTSNLSGLPTPQSLSHPSWHCSVVLAPVLHRPSCKGYNSCLCLGWANTARLQNCVRIWSIASVEGLSLEVLEKEHCMALCFTKGFWDDMCKLWFALSMSVFKSINSSQWRESQVLEFLMICCNKNI